MTQVESPSASRELVEAAVEEADLNALRLALLQVTGDESLAEMEVEKVPYGGGFSHEFKLAPRHAVAVKEAAIRFFESPPSTPPGLPSRAESRRLLELFTGELLNETEFEFAYDELAYEEFPHRAQWKREIPKEELARFHVVVIGAGVSGLAMGIQLNLLGIPYTILERQNGVGGTWLLNDYPQARTDVASYMYQFRFEKTYPWKERYASQAATRTYLEHIASNYGVDAHVKTGVEVREAHWQEATGEWLLHYSTADGGGELRANFVVGCSGLFSTPKVPEFPGLADYQGKVVHSTRWDHDYNVVGKKVAIIGNGSSGAQITPFLAAHAEHLTIFQRTPQWMSPRPDYLDTISEAQQWLLTNLPYYWNWYVYGQFANQIGLQKAQEFDGTDRADGHVNQWNDALWKTLTEYIHQKVGDDPALLGKVLPDYAPLGRRLVVDNGWYDTLRLPNVELVTSQVDSFTRDGIRTLDHAERELDLVVLATGFEVSKYFYPIHFVGRAGATLDELWAKDGPRAYLGMAMPGLPNFLSFYGPNGQPRAGGFHFWAAAWSRYAGNSIARLIENGWRSIEVSRAAYDDYNDRMDEAMSTLLWASEGSGSYYVNEFGRPGVNMPWRADVYNAMIQAPNLDDFVVAGDRASSASKAPGRPSPATTTQDALV